MSKNNANGSARRTSDEQVREANAIGTTSTEPLESNAANASYRDEADAVPGIKVLQHGTAVQLQPDCKDRDNDAKMLMKALGAEDVESAEGILFQLSEACIHNGAVDAFRLNFMLSIIKGFKPRDQVEILLATEMAAVHIQMMKFSRGLADTDTLQEVDSLGGMFNKLARTFATQVEVLQRYRSGVEQRITVQNVSVTDGGQAIVTQNTGEDIKAKSTNEPLAIADAHMTPMPILEEGPLPAFIPAKRRSRQ